MFNSKEPGKLKDDTDCEMVWAKVKIREAKDFYIGSYHKSPCKTDQEELDSLWKHSRIPTSNGAHL